MAKYIVRVTEDAGREELEWALRFTVLERDEFKCRHCSTSTPPLDIAHILSRRARPDLEFDPDNTLLLCHSCHMAYDHQNGHRPSGRPAGYKHSETTKRRIGKSNAAVKADPEWRRAQSTRSTQQWDRQGRKPERDCENCGKALERFQLTRNYRFCSTACRYAFQTGKPRSGW